MNQILENCEPNSPNLWNTNNRVLPLFLLSPWNTRYIRESNVFFFSVILDAEAGSIVHKVAIKVWCTRVEISQLLNNMCSHCLFPVIDKPETSCYHLVTTLMRPTDSQQVVLTSLISSARNKLLTSRWQPAPSNWLRTACIN